MKSSKLKIKSLKFPFSREEGFTLVELLASMFVFAVVGAIAGTILVTALRTSNKTTVLNQVMQNGNFALDEMARTIRNARNLRNPFPCLSSDPTPSPIETSSITLTDTFGSQISYNCTGSSDTPPNTIASTGASMNPQSLLDTTSVSLVSCYFTCTQQSASDYPIINIFFSLSQKSASSFTEQKASASAIPFSTSVLMRNLNR